MTIETTSSHNCCYKTANYVCDPTDRVKGIMLATLCLLTLCIANASGIGYAVAAYRDNKTTGIVCLCLVIFFDLAIAMATLLGMIKKTTYQLIEE